MLNPAYLGRCPRLLHFAPLALRVYTSNYTKDYFVLVRVASWIAGSFVSFMRVSQGIAHGRRRLPTLSRIFDERAIDDFANGFGKMRRLQP